MGDMIDILYYFPGLYREHNLWAAKINFRNPSRWQLVIWSFVHKFMSLSRCSHQNGILSVVFYSNLRDLHPWAQHIQLRRHYCLRRARMCNFFYPKCISFFNFTTLVSPLSSVLSNSPMYHIYLYPDVSSYLCDVVAFCRPLCLHYLGFFSRCVALCSSQDTV